MKVRHGVPWAGPQAAQPVWPDDILPAAGAVAVPGAPGVRAARRRVLPGQQQPRPLPVQLQQPLRGPGALPHGGGTARLGARALCSPIKANQETSAGVLSRGGLRGGAGTQEGAPQTSTSHAPHACPGREVTTPHPPTHPSFSVFVMKKQATRFRANKLYSEYKMLWGQQVFAPARCAGEGDA